MIVVTVVVGVVQLWTMEFIYESHRSIVVVVIGMMVMFLVVFIMVVIAVVSCRGG